MEIDECGSNDTRCEKEMARDNTLLQAQAGLQPVMLKFVTSSHDSSRPLVLAVCVYAFSFRLSVRLLLELVCSPHVRQH